MRVVNPWHSGGQYKNGDVLTVEQVLGNSIITKEASRLLVSSEYELYELIKVGDTVTLIDKPWEHSLWAKLPRNYKKEYITTKGKTWSVERLYNGADPLSGECAFPAGGSRYIIPLELLRKVDDGINAEWITTGMVEPKKGDLFRVIGNDGHHMHSVGDVVEFLEVASELSYETYCPKTGRTQFVHKTDLEPYDGIHRHTPEQVAEAQRIIGEIVAGFRNFECFFIRDESDKELSNSSTQKK